MNQRILRTVIAGLASGLLLATGTLGTLNQAGADEPRIALPTPPNVIENSGSAVQVHVGLPVLSKIPFVNRLFKNIGPGGEDLQVERIGIDFDFDVRADANGAVTVCPTEGAKFFSAAPAGAAVPAQFRTAPLIVEWQTPAAVGHCATASAQAPACCATNGKCAGPSCQQMSDAVMVGPHANLFVTRCSEAECVREVSGGDSVFVQAAVFEARTEMMEELLPLAIEHAKLEAKVEHLAEREEMHKQLFQLAATNAQLQARLEFQKEQMAMLEQTIKLTHENDLLKQRIAALELRGAPTAPAQARRASAAPSTRR